MKKILLTILVLLGTFTFTSSSVYAVNINIFQNCSEGSLATTDVCHSVTAQQKSGTDPILHVMKISIDLLSYIIGVIAVIMLIIAGIQMVTSGGEAQSVANARRTMIHALVGIAVAVLAQTIVVFVLSRVS